MSDRTIAPSLARELVGSPEALVTAGKLVFVDNTKEGCFFGGVGLDKLGAPKDFELVAGTMIFVPVCGRFVMSRGRGWDLCDILTGGLDPEHWKPKR